MLRRSSFVRPLAISRRLRGSEPTGSVRNLGLGRFADHAISWLISLGPRPLRGWYETSEGRKKVRYTLVSVVAVPIGTVAVGAFNLIDFTAGWSAVLGSSVAAFPSYALNRYWVWEKNDDKRFTRRNPAVLDNHAPRNRLFVLGRARSRSGHASSRHHKTLEIGDTPGSQRRRVRTLLGGEVRALQQSPICRSTRTNPQYGAGLEMSQLNVQRFDWRCQRPHRARELPISPLAGEFPVPIDHHSAPRNTLEVLFRNPPDYQSLDTLIRPHNGGCS